MSLSLVRSHCSHTYMRLTLSRECLFESCETTQCPQCSTNLITPSPSGQQILCSLRNEGGEQTGLDILPRLQEEHYLAAHPAERKCQAFLEFCQEGDVQAIAELLNDEDDDGPSVPRDDLLRYQNPLGGCESGLHAAIAGGSREVAWMLLLLASNLDELEIPALVYQEAAQLGLMRTDQTGLADIRTLRDSQGRSAGALAADGGPIWRGWEERLRVRS